MPNTRWTEWYSRNREGYLAARRKWYRKSAQDRQEANDRAQRSNERRGQYWKNHKWSQAPVLMEVQMGGKTRRVLMFPVAYLARALKRQTQIVRLWDERGVIPPTPYRVVRGTREYRLYSLGMLKATAEVVSGAKLNGGVVEPRMREEIARGVRAAWRKLGVPGMAEVHPGGGARERRTGSTSGGSRTHSASSSGGTSDRKPATAHG